MVQMTKGHVVLDQLCELFQRQDKPQLAVAMTGVVGTCMCLMQTATLEDRDRAIEMISRSVATFGPVTAMEVIELLGEILNGSN